LSSFTVVLSIEPRCLTPVHHKTNGGVGICTHQAREHFRHPVGISSLCRSVLMAPASLFIDGGNAVKSAFEAVSGTGDIWHAWRSFAALPRWGPTGTKGPGCPSRFGAAPSAPGVGRRHCRASKSERGLTSSYDDPPSHRLRPDKWEGKGSDGRLGWCALFYMPQVVEFTLSSFPFESSCFTASPSVATIAVDSYATIAVDAYATSSETSARCCT